MRRTDVLRALAVLVVIVLNPLGQTIFAQAPGRPLPTCIQNVAFPSTDEPDRRVTIVLRHGRVEQVLAPEALAPAGTRVIDGTELIALPAFLDAYTRKGVEVPAPVKDRDMPVSDSSDVRIDMRLANRKGIQPAFRVAEALALSVEQATAWQEMGFGAALVAPGGELLSGRSALVATRPAASRDLVIVPEVFAHAAFEASGPGYPSTLMGFFAQLRQFFMDVRWQEELQGRYASGRPGPRPSFDMDLVAAGALLRGEQRLACEAESARDIERWLKLADQFGLSLAVVGGNDAARVAEVLLDRELPVVLTLDWGKEVDDPEAKDKDETKDSEEPEEPEEQEVTESETGAEAATGEAAEGADLLEQEGVTEPEREPETASETEAAPEAQEEEAGESEEATVTGDAEEEPNWIYEAPMAVQIERRRLWVERRDVALRLSELSVPFAFGSADQTPKKLMDKIRTLVEAGLGRDAAQAALTTEAARLLGVDRKLGRIAVGYDATLSLWTADPLTDEKAQVLWSFVDGFGSEFEAEEIDPDAQGEPEDAAGTWELESSLGGEQSSSTLVLVQDDTGGLTGTLTYSFASEDPESTTVTGQVRGSTIEVNATLSFGDTTGEMTLEGSIDGNSLEGNASYLLPFSDDPLLAEVSGLRTPEVLLELDSHGASCHEIHNANGVIQ